MNLFSSKDDVVLDPFMGSGSTAIAVMETGRHYAGIEIESRYYKEALSRIKDHKAKPQKILLEEYLPSGDTYEWR